jgi:FtsP/CotA-like multicopper oxidase with cupredoxin domain
MEYPTEHDTIVLGAGERADLIVTPTFAPGSTQVLRSLLHDRGYGSIEYREVSTLATITMAKLPPHTPAPLPQLRRSITPLSQEGATPVDFAIDLDFPTYKINGVAFAEGRELKAKVGETQIWTVTNPTKWSHPLHLHGFFFQVLDEPGAPKRPLEWKDTVDVPYGGKVRLIVRFDDRPGAWMVHCHILDHAEGGLMTYVNVGDVSTPVDHSKHKTP